LRAKCERAQSQFAIFFELTLFTIVRFHAALANAYRAVMADHEYRRGHHLLGPAMDCASIVSFQFAASCAFLKLATDMSSTKMGAILCIQTAAWMSEHSVSVKV
jgi:hypothetical protein